MAKIDLSGSIKNLAGEELTDESGCPVTLGKTLANFLAGANGSEPAKFMGWALELMKDGVIEVDDVDRKKIKSLVESHNAMTNLLKHQILECLNV